MLPACWAWRMGQFSTRQATCLETRECGKTHPCGGACSRPNSVYLAMPSPQLHTPTRPPATLPLPSTKAEFTPLAEWVREAALFDAVSSIGFFRNYLTGRAIRAWHKARGLGVGRGGWGVLHDSRVAGRCWRMRLCRRACWWSVCATGKVAGVRLAGAACQGFRGFRHRAAGAGPACLLGREPRDGCAPRDRRTQKPRRWCAAGTLAACATPSRAGCSPRSRPSCPRFPRSGGTLTI
jgi:hypothetical protein